MRASAISSPSCSRTPAAPAPGASTSPSSASRPNSRATGSSPSSTTAPVSPIRRCCCPLANRAGMPGPPNARMPPAWGSCRSRAAVALCARACGAKRRQPGWRLLLTPDHFLGSDDAQAVPDDEGPSPHGTAIAFVAHETAEAIRAAVAGAARFAPLPVTFNAEAVPQESFLDGACHTERWAGLTLGVFKNRHDPFNQPDLNFHGLTLNVRLPRVQTLDGDTWSVRAEVESCPELELVLPARKEAVETSFLATLREAVREPIYHALAVADPAPRVAFDGSPGRCPAGHPAAGPAGGTAPLAARHGGRGRLARSDAVHARRGRCARHGVRPRSPGGPGVVPRRRAGGASPAAVRGRPAPGGLSLVRRAGAGA